MASAESLAREHGVSVAAVNVLQDALRRGGGRQAQFSHPDLGGMGQWSAGGMTQVGDMFNTALKDKVNRLCTALADDAAQQPAPPQHGGSADWWPDGLGRPSATGAQNGMRYACFRTRTGSRWSRPARSRCMTVANTGSVGCPSSRAARRS